MSPPPGSDDAAFGVAGDAADFASFGVTVANGSAIVGGESCGFLATSNLEASQLIAAPTLRRGGVLGVGVPRLSMHATCTTVGSDCTRMPQSLSPRGQREAQTLPSPPNTLAFPVLASTHSALNSSRSASPRGQGHSVPTLLPSEAGSRHLLHQSLFNYPSSSVTAPPMATVGLASLTGYSTPHASIGRSSMGRASLGSPQQSATKVSPGKTPLGLASLTGTTSSPLRFPTGRPSLTAMGSSPPSARSGLAPMLAAATSGIARVGTRVGELRDDENDKENVSARTLNFGPTDKEKKPDIIQSQIEGNLDNTLLYGNTSSFALSQSMKPDNVTRALGPTTWAWDAKWASDVDFEEDEMHNQLFLQQPADAPRFKRIDSGKYLFEGRTVEMKIVFGQLFVTSADDGQVRTFEDFLSTQATTTPRLSSIIAGTANFVSIANATVGNGHFATILGSRGSVNAGAGHGISHDAGSVLSTTDNSPPPSPAASLKSTRPSSQPRRAGGQQASHGRSTPLVKAWQASPRSLKGSFEGIDTRPFSARMRTYTD